jgi:hypothetical protein
VDRLFVFLHPVHDVHFPSLSLIFFFLHFVQFSSLVRWSLLDVLLQPISGVTVSSRSKS